MTIKIDSGASADLTMVDRPRLGELEREQKELRWANEILRLPSTFSLRRNLRAWYVTPRRRSSQHGDDRASAHRHPGERKCVGKQPYPVKAP